MKTPLISVIIPIYNVELYLNRCIESVLNQTYRHLEVILIDDGSQDNCKVICDAYSNKDNRVKVIHKKNGGLSDARNVGLDLATGDFIGFVDSDDWIEKDMYEVLYNTMIENMADISQCMFMRDLNNSNKKVESKKCSEKRTISNIQAMKELYGKEYVQTVVVWNKLYKKKLFDFLRFPVGMINEDEAVIHEVLYNACKITIISNPLYHYNIRNDSITKCQFSIKKLDAIKAIEMRIDYLMKTKESELLKMTYSRYFRILLHISTEVFFSEIEDRRNIILMIEEKMKRNLPLIKKCKLKTVDYLLLKLYISNKVASYMACRALELTKPIFYNLGGVK